MRYLMYANSYDDHALAAAQFNQISPRVQSRLTRLDYATAERKCPQGLPIAQLMQAAKKKLAT
jgi:predicted aldo/keto reductase-like oxidoreductase